MLGVTFPSDPFLSFFFLRVYMSGEFSKPGVAGALPASLLSMQQKSKDRDSKKKGEKKREKESDRKQMLGKKVV